MLETYPRTSPVEIHPVWSGRWGHGLKFTTLPPSVSYSIARITLSAVYRLELIPVFDRFGHYTYDAPGTIFLAMLKTPLPTSCVNYSAVLYTSCIYVAMYTVSV